MITRLEPDAKFCPVCGNSLKEVEKVPPTFDQHTGEREKIKVCITSGCKKWCEDIGGHFYGPWRGSWWSDPRERECTKCGYVGRWSGYV